MFCQKLGFTFTIILLITIGEAKDFLLGQEAVFTCQVKCQAPGPSPGPCLVLTWTDGHWYLLCRYRNCKAEAFLLLDKFDFPTNYPTLFAFLSEESAVH